MFRLGDDEPISSEASIPGAPLSGPRTVGVWPLPSEKKRMKNSARSKGAIRRSR
jgi:hypothetical protein